MGCSAVYGLLTKVSNLSSLFLMQHWKQMQERGLTYINTAALFLRYLDLTTLVLLT